MDQTPIVSLAAGHPLIDVDLTVVIQFALFLVLFFFSNKLLFQPYLALRERRLAFHHGEDPPQTRPADSLAEPHGPACARHRSASDT